MRNPIRISGLIVFAVIVGMLILTLSLAINPVVGRVITTAGSEAVGAKVELDAADVSLTEQRIALQTLAVTDPRQPMFNLFEVSELVVDVDGDAMMWNKLVIDELKVTNLYLNTPRTESGEYQKRWLEKSNWNPMASIPGLADMSVDNLPDAEEVIARESLQTPAAIQSFKQDLATTKTELSEKIKALPDEEKLKEYERRFEEIKAKSKGGNKLVGLLSQGKDIKDLQKDIKEDLAQVKALKNEIKAAQDKISADFKALKKMPGEDLQRLKAKYSLSGNGVQEIVSTLFGEQIGRWAQKGWHYYQMVSPYLNSYSGADESDSKVKVSPHITERGRKVLFEDKNPLPNYLVKKVELSSELQDFGIAVSGLIENMTTEPDKWASPMTMDLTGKSGLMKSFTVKGLFDHRDVTASMDDIKLNASGLLLNQLVTSQPSSPYVINKGEVDIKADIKRNAGYLDGQIRLTFNGLNMSSSRTEAWQNRMLNGINKLDSFAVTINLSGALEKPEISINSADLKTIGQAVIKEMASDKIAEFEQDLQQRIQESTAGLLSDAEGLGDLTPLLKQLNLAELNLDKLLEIKL